MARNNPMRLTAAGYCPTDHSRPADTKRIRDMEIGYEPGFGVWRRFDHWKPGRRQVRASGFAGARWVG